MVTWNYFQLFHNWLTWYLLVVYWINVLVIDMTWIFLHTPWCNAFQFKILWFRSVSVSTKSFGQFSVSVSVSEPKPKRWFQSCTMTNASGSVSRPSPIPSYSALVLLWRNLKLLFTNNSSFCFSFSFLDYIHEFLIRAEMSQCNIDVNW